MGKFTWWYNLVDWSRCLKIVTLAQPYRMEIQQPMLFSPHCRNKPEINRWQTAPKRIFNHCLDAIFPEDDNSLHRTTVVTDSVEDILWKYTHKEKVIKKRYCTHSKLLNLVSTSSIWRINVINFTWTVVEILSNSHFDFCFESFVFLCASFPQIFVMTKNYFCNKK